MVGIHESSADQAGTCGGYFGARPAYYRCCPVVSTSRPVTYGGNSIAPVSIQGSTGEYERVHVVELASGRFYSEMDNRTARRVAVIGANVAETLFPVENPLGKPIRIAGHQFQVIGVMEKKGQGAEGPQSVDQQARIPLQAFANAFGLRYRDISVQARLARAPIWIRPRMN